MRRPRGRTSGLPGARFAVTAYALIATALAALSALGSTKAEAVPDLGAVDAIVARLMAAYDIPGVAVALIQHGSIVLAKGYGYRDVAASAPVTAHTLFGIGSITKSFTALAVAQLVDQGKLDLDAPVATYVPDLRLRGPRTTRTVTLGQLLSHSSGLVRDDRWVTRVPASRAQVIRDMATIKITAAPGERFQYCNQNFVLAGYALERVTGQSWEAYTREHILVPLGIDSAVFSTADMQSAPDFARPYLPDVRRGHVSVPLTSGPYRALGALGPAGSINASVVDMARYAQFQLGDGTFQGGRIVSPRMLSEMRRPHIALGTSPEGLTIQALSLANVTNYGLGWFLEDYRGAHLVEHGGAFVGFTANVTLIPSGQDGVVVLTNADSAGAFVEAVRLSLVEWLLDITPRRDVATELDARSRLVLGVDPGRYNTLATAARAYQGSPAALHQWTGEYTGPGTKATITAAGDALLVRGISDDLGAVTSELVPVAADRFLVNYTRGSVVTFRTNDEGVVTLYRDGAPQSNRQGSAGRDGAYTDPGGRFRIIVPAGLRVSREGRILVMRSAEPPALFLATSAEPDRAGLDATVERFVAHALPLTDRRVVQKPRDLGIARGRLAVYGLPGRELVAVAALAGRNAVFITSAFGTPEALRALNSTLVFILRSYQPTSQAR